MTMTIRRLIQLALGIAGGIAVWPVTEMMIHLQSHFHRYSIYTVLSGALFGLVFGAILGGAEGVIASRRRRIVAGSALGGIVGAVGGAIGFLIGQWLMFVIGDRLASTVQEINRIAVPIGRAVGWAILGAFVGSSGGVRSFSGRKTLIGALGGFAGGLLGGLLVEYGRVVIAAGSIALPIGLVLLGLLIGGAYAWVEKRLSFGVLRVLNGPFKSREFILNQRRTSIGSRAGCDIPVPSPRSDEVDDPRGVIPRSLRGYAELAPLHCRIQARGRHLFIQPLEGAVLLNDRSVPADGSSNGGPLKYQDVIACGQAKFLYLQG